jgi:hypothetical protein
MNINLKGNYKITNTFRAVVCKYHTRSCNAEILEQFQTKFVNMRFQVLTAASMMFRAALRDRERFVSVLEDFASQKSGRKPDSRRQD